MADTIHINELGADVVRNVLRIDRECREQTPEGIQKREGDLIDLSSINVMKHWDHSLPTGYESFDRTRKPVSTSSRTLKILNNEIKVFGGVDMNGILIAGGSVLSMIHGKWSIGTDVDLFLCGYKTTEELENRVQKLVAELFKNKTTYRPILMIRTVHAITLKIDLCKIQIVLRRYETPSQVLHGFDIGSCQVGIWNDRVITTTLGKFALEYQMNIFDLSRRSTSYEYRILYKYAGRDYGVIFPELDIQKMSKAMKSHPRGEFFDANVHLKMIKFHPKNKNTFEFYHLPDYHSDYCLNVNVDDFYDMNKVKEFNLYKIIAAKDLSKVPERLVFARECETAEELAKCIFDTEFDYPTKEDIATFYAHKPLVDRSQFFVGRAKRFYGTIDPATLFDTFCIQRNASEFRQIIIDTCVDNAVNRLQKLKDQNPTFAVNWILENPGQQLTGSFYPVVTSPEEWFGEYYRPFELDE